MLNKNSLISLFTIVFFLLIADNNYSQSFYKRNFKDIKFLNWDKDSRPFLELNYGSGKIKHKKSEGTFSDVNIIGFKAGYSGIEIFDDDYLIELNESFIELTFLSSKIGAIKRTTGDIKSEQLKFGFGQTDGYGYRFSSFDIIPYSQYSVVWSKSDFIELEKATLSINDLKILDRYNNNFRFGNAYGGGIKFSVGSYFSLNTSYEANVIYPRHLFWKQLGSYIIYQVGEEAIGYFVDEIIDSSPAAGPVVNFLLKNAFSYAFYVLQRDKMNWPFSTETPLTYETIRIGTTFTF